MAVAPDQHAPPGSPERQAWLRLAAAHSFNMMKLTDPRALALAIDLERDAERDAKEREGQPELFARVGPGRPSLFSAEADELILECESTAHAMDALYERGLLNNLTAAQVSKRRSYLVGRQRKEAEHGEE